MRSSRPVLLLLLSLFPLLVHAQTSNLRIVFPKHRRTPRGWTRYDPTQLTPDATIGSNGRSAPFRFRFFVRRQKTFTYLANGLLPGTYKVRFGFYDRFVCVENRRIFRMEANGISTPHIDLFKDAGACAVAHHVVVKNVNVQQHGVLNVTAVSVKGPKPILNTLEIMGLSVTQTEPSSSPTPTTETQAVATEMPTTTETVSPSPTASATASVTASVSPSNSPSASPSASMDASPSASTDASPSVSATPSLSPSPSPSAQQTVFADSAKVAFHKFKLPNGWQTYDTDGLDVDVQFSSGGVAAGPDPAYVSHMKKRSDFTYVHRLAAGVYDIRLGFLEFGSACVVGKRVFKVSVNGKSTRNIDVFRAAGCNAPLDRWLRQVTVGSDQRLVFQFTNVDGFAPFIANFEATLHDPDTTGNIPADIDLEINAGSKSDIPLSGSSKTFYSGDIVDIDGVAPLFYYKSSRFGKNFTYSFDLDPGAYDIVLGFAENYTPLHCSEPGKRVFNVYINNLIQLEGFDIFEKVGCHVPHEVTIPGQTVGAVDTKPLTIRFTAISNNAQVNYIRIKTAEDRCIPESSSGGFEDGENHAAHAVPGTYPPQLNANSPSSYVDADGDGYVYVDIDGSGSHTHFFDAAANVIGRLTEYKWTLAETGEVISTEEKFKYKFPLGTTRLKLYVLDNSCTTDEAETVVTVTGKIQPGQYCYYYQGLEEPPRGGDLLTEMISPSFAHISYSANLGFPSFDFDETKFGMRCTFFLQVDEDTPMSEIAIDTGDTGIARLYKGADLILDTSSSPSVTTTLSMGLTAFELVYLRTSEANVPASLKFSVDGAVPPNSHISHDRTTVVPILSAVSPKEGKLSGGDKIKVTGYGLFQPLTVTFGSQSVPVLKDGRSKHQFFVISPGSSSPDPVAITVTSAGGLTSNSVFFSYGGTCDAIKFIKTTMITGLDQPFNLHFPTSAVLGHDGKLYMGTLGGTVQVISYHHEDLRVSSQCYSKAIRDPEFVDKYGPAPRDILGIAIDPRDIEIRPVVSTSTLYWLERKRLTNDTSVAWRNGAVDRLKPGTDPSDAGVCLVYDTRLVSYLPVSNHDHAVNALLFTQDGDLLISVGGFTNMGLPGYKLGGFWETALSAAVLKARINAPGFDGTLQYENEDVLRLATLKPTPFVSLYATGIRNGFGMGMTKSGEVYVGDQGPNCGFGDTATTCDDYDEELAAAWDPLAEMDWTGRGGHGWTNCPHGPGRPDKLLHLTEGAYYGHPNLNRGECIWVDPNNHLTATNDPPPAAYKPHVITMKSPVTGVGQYGGNDFCGRLRHNLILSTYKSGNTYRLQVDGNSAATETAETISDDGGITFVENAHGDLLFPQLSAARMFVLRPQRTPKARLFIANAVPWRHGANGGTTITVGGDNFGSSPQVLVGGKMCTVTFNSKTEIRCIVPAGNGLVDVQVSTEDEVDTLIDAVLYMTV